MIRLIARYVTVAALVGAGWAAGRAQAVQPDFEIVIDAPAGETSVVCVRGCDLAWVQRGLNRNATPAPTFTFKCGDPSRCSSGKVGGWTKP
jgi:hypothetical protein